MSVIVLSKFLASACSHAASEIQALKSKAGYLNEIWKLFAVNSVKKTTQHKPEIHVTTLNDQFINRCEGPLTAV